MYDREPNNKSPYRFGFDIFGGYRYDGADYSPLSGSIRLVSVPVDRKERILFES